MVRNSKFLLQQPSFILTIYDAGDERGASHSIQENENADEEKERRSDEENDEGSQSHSNDSNDDVQSEPDDVDIDNVDVKQLTRYCF